MIMIEFESNDNIIFLPVFVRLPHPVTTHLVSGGNLDASTQIGFTVRLN